MLICATDWSQDNIYFISNKYTRFSFHSSKSLPVKFQQKNSRGEHRQSNRAVQIRRYQRQSAHQNNLNHFKSILQKSETTHRPSQPINTPIKPSSTPPYHPHPEERIWAGRTPRAPDAPKNKHDKMKQFYMVDMRRKM